MTTLEKYLIDDNLFVGAKLAISLELRDSIPVLFLFYKWESMAMMKVFCLALCKKVSWPGH